jgi:hypothetical protein
MKRGLTETNVISLRLALTVTGEDAGGIGHDSMILISWFFYSIFLIAVVAPIIVAVIPYGTIVSMWNWKYAVGIGAIIVAWHVFVRYLTPYDSNTFLIFNPIYSLVSAVFAVIGVFTRFATLTMEANGYSWAVSLLIHASVYFMTAYLLIRWASSFW